MNFWSIISSGIIAGLIAGFLLAALILNFSTPLVLKAEKYEHQSTAEDHNKTTEHHQAESEGPNPQRNIGTLIGSLIIGIVYGLFLAIINSFLGKRSSQNQILKGLILGVAGYLILFFVPSLAFMPALPGVEAKFSASIRQSWWFLVILFEFIGLLVYWFIFKQAKISGLFKHVIGLVSFLAIVSIPFLYGLPNQTLQSPVPNQLLLNFRLITFAVIFIFWTALGLTIGWFNTKLKLTS